MPAVAPCTALCPREAQSFRKLEPLGHLLQFLFQPLVQTHLVHGKGSINRIDLVSPGFQTRESGVDEVRNRWARLLLMMPVVLGHDTIPRISFEAELVVLAPDPGLDVLPNLSRTDVIVESQSSFRPEEIPPVR